MKTKPLDQFYIVSGIIVAVFVFQGKATDHQNSKPRTIHNDIENNYISDVPETAASHNSLAFRYNERLNDARQRYAPGLQPPSGFATTSRRLFNEKESMKADRYSTPNEHKEYASYILTAGGKENIYEDDSVPDRIEVSYPPKHSEQEKTPLKKIQFGKSVKKYRYAYSNHRNSDSSMLQSAISEQNDHEKPPPVALQPEYRVPQEFVTARNFNGGHPEGHHYAYVLHPHPNRHIHDKTDVYGAKSSTWKQLGPNVEISSSAENPSAALYSRQIDVSSVDRKKMKQKRKNVPKNIRNGYMTQQHALYVANNLQNIKPPPSKGLFDHSNVLKQSDKFEITDAMIMDVEKDEVQKPAAGKGQPKLRIKQESPKEQLYHYEPSDIQSLQYYGQPSAQFLNLHQVDSNALHNKYYAPYTPQLGAFSKGFIRNIEIETNSPGGKRSITALIIPLTPEQLNNPFFHNEIVATPLYVNNPEVLNPKPKPVVHAFPYEIVNPTRLPPNEVINAIIPVENYHFQQLPPQPQQYKPHVDESYNPYVNYQNQNIFHRIPFNYNPSTTPATGMETNKAASPIAFSTQSVVIHTTEPKAARFNAPYAAPPSGRKATNVQVNLEKIEPVQKEIQYTFEQVHNEKYLAPSETNYFTTVTSSKEHTDDAQLFEKSDTRRN